MRFALLVFKKDVRRLWWEVLITLVLLAALARMDCYRWDYVAGSMEGLMNLLVPFAWAYLIAVLIQQESLVGDRQFWISRPYRWPALLAAKAFFVLAFIHIPLFLADCTILLYHGFQPLAYLPSLLSKQVLLAFVITLPAAGLAAVTKNLAQFLLAAVAICGSGAILAGSVEPYLVPWIAVDAVRRGIPIALIVLAAAAIILLQFRGRRTWLSRSTGVGAILAAALLYGYLPRAFTASVECALPGPKTDNRQLAVTLRSPGPTGLIARSSSRGHELSIPIAVAGLPPGASVRFEMLQFEIMNSHGDRWKARFTSKNAGLGSDRILAGIGIQGENGWQSVYLESSIFNRILDDKITVRGKAEASIYRQEGSARMSLGDAATSMPGIGRCSSLVVPGYSYQDEMLKVLCESPREIPLFTGVRLSSPAAAQDWNQRLGDSAPGPPGPPGTWLSPLERRETYFYLTDRAVTRPSYSVPRSALSGATLSFNFQKLTGRVIVDYELQNLTTKDYADKAPPSQGRLIAVPSPLR